ncbi:hypothetical protein ACJX0J_013515, partial [Zea mays]
AISRVIDVDDKLCFVHLHVIILYLWEPHLLPQRKWNGTYICFVLGGLGLSKAFLLGIDLLYFRFIDAPLAKCILNYMHIVALSTPAHHAPVTLHIDIEPIALGYPMT